MTSPAPTIADLASKLDTLLSLQEAPPQRYLTIKQTATYCGLSADSVRRLLSSGKLQRLRPVPGAVRIDKIDLDDFLASTVDGCHGGGRGCAKKNAGRGSLRSPRPANGEVCDVNSSK